MRWHRQKTEAQVPDGARRIDWWALLVTGNHNLRSERLWWLKRWWKASLLCKIGCHIFSETNWEHDLQHRVIEFRCGTKNGCDIPVWAVYEDDTPKAIRDDSRQIIQDLKDKPPHSTGDLLT